MCLRRIPKQSQYRKRVSGVVHPVGPKPTTVYWRRRAIFAVLVLLTLYLFGRTIFGGNDSSGAPLTAPSKSSTASVSPSTSTKPSVSASPSASDAPSEENIVDPISLQSASPVATKTQPPGTCGDDEVSVKVSIRKNAIKVGAGLDLNMSVKNISDNSCKRDVGSGANEITIISGPALVWSTDHCGPGTESNYVELAPGETWSVHVLWNGKLSSPNCQVLANAQYGAYWAHARNGAVVSSGARFVIQ